MDTNTLKSGEVSSPPFAGQEGTSATSPTKDNVNPATSFKEFTFKDFHTRDLNAVAYSKCLLEEGDTLVIIKYPGNCEVFDSTGFKIGAESFKVHSEKLLGTGSKVFEKLFSDWEQTKFRRRNGFVQGLPIGIKYILNLTPPDEGDEAVNLTAELYCSVGIRSWFSAEERCKVPRSICGGMDEKTRVMKPKSPQKHHDNLVDALTDFSFEPEIRANSGINFDEAIEIDSSHSRISFKSRQEHEDRELAKALHLSKVELFNPQAVASYQAYYKTIDEIPAYCPIRHRVGIEKLLQLIEGKEPRFDSAPKIWTLFVLAKYFDCTNVAVDTIVSWVLDEPNCRFIEILPEATLKMGLGLETPLLARPAFAILVSEYALTTISREYGGALADKTNTNQFGRAREDVGEDDLDAIQAAAYNFTAKVERSVKQLLDNNMGWLSSLPEYQKLERFLNWATSDNAIFEKKSIVEAFAELNNLLGNFVRGLIIWILNSHMRTDVNSKANDHRRAESYLKIYSLNFDEDIYISMAEKEKLLTVFPWRALRSVDFNAVGSNHVRDDSGDTAWGSAPDWKVTDFRGVEPVYVQDLERAVEEFNAKIMKAIGDHGFNNGNFPPECYKRVWADSVNDDIHGGEEDDSSTTTLSSKSFSFRQKASCTASGQDFQELLYVENSGQQRLQAGGSLASTACVTNLPLRLKDIAEFPSFDPFISGDGETGQMVDPRAKAIALHEASTSPGFSAVMHRFTPKLPTLPMPLPTIPVKPELPSTYKVNENSPLIALNLFNKQATEYVRKEADRMLSKSEDLEFTVLTDTLLNLDDEQYKFLPLWAGGLNDGTGGVFAGMVPEAPAGAGPAGPGPSFHTGYSMGSRQSTEMDFDGSSTIGGSFNTSLAVDNGLDDHLDRLRVVSDSEDNFGTEAFSDDTERYGGHLEEDSEAYVEKGKGEAVAKDVSTSDAFREVTVDDFVGIKLSAPEAEDQNEVEWDAEDEDEAFDYDEELDEDVDEDTDMKL